MGLCKQVIYETHVGKAFQAGAVCHRAMTLTLQSSIINVNKRPQDKQHVMTSRFTKSTKHSLTQPDVMTRMLLLGCCSVYACMGASRSNRTFAPSGDVKGTVWDCCGCCPLDE